MTLVLVAGHLLVVEQFFAFVKRKGQVTKRELSLAVFPFSYLLGKQTEQVYERAGKRKQRIVWKFTMSNVVGELADQFFEFSGVLARNQKQLTYKK